VFDWFGDIFKIRSQGRRQVGDTLKFEIKLFKSWAEENVEFWIMEYQKGPSNYLVSAYHFFEFLKSSQQTQSLIKNEYLN
jgi:hypothetical protein